MFRLSSLIACTLVVSLVAPAAWADLLVREQWRWTGADDPHDRPHPDGVPIVVQLTDDDGDGQVTGDDVPDVVFLHWKVNGTEAAAVTALDGATGAEHYTLLDRPFPAPVLTSGSLLAAADLDGDGVVELAVSDRSAVNIYEEDGTFVRAVGWPAALRTPAALGIADFDLDGTPDFHAEDKVVSSDGSWSWVGGVGTGTGIGGAVDLDPGSPGLELLIGNVLYDSGGALLWRSADAPWGEAVVADFEGDGDPEVAIVSGTQVHVLDRRGASRALPFDLGRGGLGPLVADLDGDGLPELVLTTGDLLWALAWEGGELVVRWQTPVQDGSCCAEPTAYDLTGDGGADVIFSDQEEWLVACGRDGSVLYREPFVSATAHEQPIVADIDGDGVTEVLVFGLQGRTGVTENMDSMVAYEVPSSPPARAIWNQQSYHVTNIEDDGTVPIGETPPWTIGAGWESQAPAGDLPPFPEPFDEGLVTDVSPCSPGLLVTWEEAPGATYSVYRSVGPGADCDAALASPPVAVGLVETRWFDSATVPGESHVYVVLPIGGALIDCSDQMLCLGAVEDVGVPFPEGVDATLRAAHDEDEITLSWAGARALLPDEHFHLLKAVDEPIAAFNRANPEDDRGRSHVETDLTSPLQFFDLRVANPCEEQSADEFPPDY